VTVERLPVGPFRCSTSAISRGDPLVATAPPARRWLLLEHPGPWGPRGLWDVVDHQVADDLLAYAAEAEARVLLIRGPGRRRARGWRWYIADTHPARESLVRGEFGRISDMGAIDLTAPPGSHVAEPLYLACTHSRHDPCCAIRGRPLADALSRLRPLHAWECTHVGGDRFAGNAVVLPYGLYYGHLRADDARAVVEATDAGRVLLRKFRGRAGSTPVEQAGEDGYRRSHGADGVDDVRILGSAQLYDSTWRVDLETISGRAACLVTVGHQTVDTPLTCGGQRASSYPTYDVSVL
jgi:hypothetical protein